MAANMAAMAAMMQNVQMPEVVILPKPPMFTDNLARNDWLSRASKYVQNMVIGPESMVVRNRYIYTGLQDGWVVEVIPPPPFGSGPRVRRILRMSTPECKTGVQDESLCGRPLGVRADKQGYLVVTDAYKGIFRINPRNGRYKQLFNTANKVKGETVGFINDLTIADDGTIIFTSSSQKYNRTNFLDIILEGETTGKVLVYNPRLSPPNQVQELASNLGFPNGIELAADNSYVLIAEGGRAKIHRVWIGANTAKRGRLEVFAENLPGFVDNIRRTPRGTYWVGISSIRSDEMPSVLDRFGDKPQMRRGIMRLPREQLIARTPKWGMAVELNEDGQIIRSLQDPEGRLFTAVSEVQEEDGLLYIGSFDRPYIGILNETLLPRPKLPTPEATVPAGPDNGVGTGTGGSTGGTTNTGTGAGSGTGGSVPNPGTGGGSVPNPGTGGGSVPNPGTGGGSVPNPGTGGGSVPNPGTGGGATTGQNGGTPGTNPNNNGGPGSPSGPADSGSAVKPVASVGRTPQITAFLQRVLTNAMRMGGQQRTETIVALVKRLIDYAAEIRKLTERTNRLEESLSALQQIPGIGSGPGPGTGTGTGAGTGTQIETTPRTVAGTTSGTGSGAPSSGSTTGTSSSTSISPVAGSGATTAANAGPPTSTPSPAADATTAQSQAQTTANAPTPAGTTVGPDTTVAPTAGPDTTVAPTAGTVTTVASTASADAGTTTPAPIPPAVTTAAVGTANDDDGNPEGTSIVQTSPPTTTALATEASLLATTTIPPEL
ncbi:adipocyte plasma membrane-associated protein Hemomucin-like isoform X1 [Littorina saxatilis]|uniref:Strictosidine synthase conserved region domain-containing protein n=1 Tax=Littorina saxatilis TaxID=31220 RepID=A0AAN9GCS5_9CAEN